MRWLRCRQWYSQVILLFSGVALIQRAPCPGVLQSAKILGLVENLEAPKRTWNWITNRYDPPLLIRFSSLFFQFASSWFCYGVCAARCCCGCEVAVAMLRANSQLLIECETEGGRLKSETEWRLNRVKFEPNEDWRYWVLEEEAWGLKKMRVKNVTCRKMKNLLRMRLIRSIYRLLSFNSVRDGELLVIWLWVIFFLLELVSYNFC